MLTPGPPPGRTTAAATTDPVLTRERVAEMFRVSPRTVQRWGKSGKLRSLRASDVAELINSAAVQASLSPRRQGQRP